MVVWRDHGEWPESNFQIETRCKIVFKIYNKRKQNVVFTHFLLNVFSICTRLTPECSGIAKYP